MCVCFEGLFLIVFFFLSVRVNNGLLSVAVDRRQTHPLSCLSHWLYKICRSALKPAHPLVSKESRVACWRMRRWPSFLMSSRCRSQVLVKIKRDHHRLITLRLDCSKKCPVREFPIRTSHPVPLTPHLHDGNPQTNGRCYCPPDLGVSGRNMAVHCRRRLANTWLHGGCL